MLTLSPFVTPQWFIDAFMKLFDYPCFNSIYFSTALFLQFAFHALISLYRSFTVKQILKKIITLISALGYVFLELSLKP